MTLLKTRNRLVNFRLTQEEVESLKVACLVKGARNISDFARTAVLESVASQTEPGMLVQRRLAALDSRVSEIGLTLEYVAELLKGTLKGLAAPRPEPGGPRAPAE